ncbi:MAG TPA: aminotransferase class III-fold pyridoxal phosphate-dependent enzyme [Solirubrobacteraceae bacterium]|nr:aminotransferase class III-fold pyridoxal phosphate-dependent enzyme [Solirubrobacteraceae bacterium]
MDPVLVGARPRLDANVAVEIARDVFGVATATAARDLGSERDRTFLLADAQEQPLAILKVSNSAEDPAVLDMEAAVALHVARVDPSLTVAQPKRPTHTGEAEGDGVEGLRAPWRDGDGTLHWTRLYDVLPGHSRIPATELTDAALIAWGETAARLGRALRGFTHPQAHRTMLWDVQHALRTRAMLGDIPDPEARATVARTLDAFEERALPLWPLLRAQTVHTDLSVDNTLTDDDGFITGIIDFGDMSHSALVTELASALESVLSGREGDEIFRAARLVLDGFQRHVPLEDDELRTVGIAWAARCAVTVAISSWRAARGLEDAAFAERYNARCLRTLETMQAVGWDAVERALGAPAPAKPDPGLAPKRAAVFGPAVDPLFYDEPIQVAHAQGVHLTDASGRTFLDAYNNVPCIGHAHPRVTAAIARQSRQVNTHTRYLHPAALELAERLTASCPPGLDTVMFVNSGSEANDLAWRMAAAATGNGGALCTAFAYHGITEATAALSPEGWFDGRAPAHVERWEPLDSYRGRHLDGQAFARALARLRERGLAPAAAILDGVLTSDGIEDLPSEHVRDLVGQVRAAGGLWIADEVQAGHGRTGEALWSFERAGIVPDFVTLGKPMGNGHPVAAIITRREIVAQLVGRTTLFSTFGGNPVSAAAALAVLDVIEDERVLDRVQRTSAALRAALADVAQRHPGIGDVRGIGLAWGIELVLDPVAKEPDAARARAVRDAMRHEGVLVGTTGPAGNVLKIRPPLALTPAHVPTLAGALDAAMASTATG